MSVNRWFDGLSDWQCVAVVAGLCGLACTGEGVLAVLAVGHLDLASFVRFWCVQTLMLCIVGVVVQRRRRNRRVRR